MKTNVVIAAIEHIQNEIRTMADVVYDTEGLTMDELMELENFRAHTLEAVHALYMAEEEIRRMDRWKEKLAKDEECGD